MILRPLTRLIAKRVQSRRRPPAWPHGQILCEFPTLSMPLVDMRNADHRLIASTCRSTTCTRSWWRGCGPPGRSGEFPFPLSSMFLTQHLFHRFHCTPNEYCQKSSGPATISRKSIAVHKKAIVLEIWMSKSKTRGWIAHSTGPTPTCNPTGRRYNIRSSIRSSSSGLFTSNRARQSSNAQAGQNATIRITIAPRKPLFDQKDGLLLGCGYRWILDAGLMTSDIVLAMHSQPREVGKGPGLSVRAIPIPVRPRLV